MKSASVIEKKLSQEVASSLRDLVQPYFLRREKKQVFAAPNSASKLNVDQKKDQLQILKCRKNDFVVWISITNVQHTIYSNFLETEEVKNVSIH